MERDKLRKLKMMACLMIAKENDDPLYYIYMAARQPHNHQLDAAFEYGYQMGYRHASNGNKSIY